MRQDLPLVAGPPDAEPRDAWLPPRQNTYAVRGFLATLAAVLLVACAGINPPGNATPATGSIAGTAAWTNIDGALYSVTCTPRPQATVHDKTSAVQPVTSGHVAE